MDLGPRRGRVDDVAHLPVQEHRSALGEVEPPLAELADLVGDRDRLAHRREQPASAPDLLDDVALVDRGHVVEADEGEVVQIGIVATPPEDHVVECLELLAGQGLLGDPPDVETRRPQLVDEPVGAVAEHRDRLALVDPDVALHRRVEQQVEQLRQRIARGDDVVDRDRAEALDAVHDRDLLGVRIVPRDRDVRVDEVRREAVGVGEVQLAKLVGREAVLARGAADRLVLRDRLRSRRRRRALVGDAAREREADECEACDSTRAGSGRRTVAAATWTGNRSEHRCGSVALSAWTIPTAARAGTVSPPAERRKGPGRKTSIAATSCPRADDPLSRS